MAELLACFPVYRTYLPDGREHLDQALAAARRHRPDLADLDALPRCSPTRPRRPALRFQQTTGTVMAKGVEDTAFYRWTRLTSLNEVGGDPSRLRGRRRTSSTPRWPQRQRDWPDAMTTLSTHDTKRGEDVRARLAVLAEVPDAVARRARPGCWSWRRCPTRRSRTCSGRPSLGAWPIERASGCTRTPRRRRARPATTPAGRARRGVRGRGARRRRRGVRRRRRCAPTSTGCVDAVSRPGWCNALAAKLVQLTMPGVPDVYQGTELWDHSLVDPDNRRPVDFDLRRALLGRLAG